MSSFLMFFNVFIIVVGFIMMFVPFVFQKIWDTHEYRHAFWSGGLMIVILGLTFLSFITQM